MRRRALVGAILAVLLAAVTVVAGCGRDRSGDRGREGESTRSPALGVGRDESEAAEDLGFPAFATKNTTRVGGSDAVANAAGVARAVFPGPSVKTRPGAVALVDARDWRIGVAAAVLAGTEVKAPILLSNGPDLPTASEDALGALAPTGSKAAGNAQVIRVGDVARPAGLRSADIKGADPFALAHAIDAF